MNVQKHDIIIIGGGPGGSHAATLLAKKGFDVAIVEREEYPRFHIGESLLPASMPLLKESGFYEVLNSGKYITKCGARFIDYRNEDEVYFGFAEGFNTDIPTAFEVERSHFDKDILAFAVKSGAKLYQPENVLEVDLLADGVRIQTDKHLFEAQYVMDISGRDSILGKRMKMREVNADLNNVAVFAHYKGVKRKPGRDEGDIIIGLLPNRSWTWIIPFKGDVTSVGVVASAKFAGNVDLEAYLNESLLQSETVKNLMKDSERCSEFRSIGNYSHTCKKFYGDRWILCGDAAMFLDPIFSSGVHMSLSSSTFAVETIIKAFADKRSLNDPDLGAPYEALVRKGAKRFHNLISLFYEGHFVEQMKKTLVRENMRKGFTSAVAGDVWNEGNFLFSKNVL
ncbi:MAG: NAD(P)/FAD-dependent oxidoreductase [Bdellovibrionales bacterium]